MSMIQHLKNNVTLADLVSRKKNGNYLFRHSFFYTHGYTSDEYAKHIQKELNRLGVKHEIVHSYEKWTDFRGGAPIQRQSHWGVEVKII